MKGTKPLKIVPTRTPGKLALSGFGATMLDKAQRLVHEAEAFKRSGLAMAQGDIGSVRLGLGSGPGALLTVPLLLGAAKDHPRMQLDISRGNTTVLARALREQKLDAIIVDIRSLRPAADLHISHQVEMSASFMCRPAHPLTRKRKALSFDDLRAYPIASTPLSDEVARMLTERYGAQANPEDMVSLRTDDTSSLVELARHSDAVVLTINAAGLDLHRLNVQPAVDATARFGLVTLTDRSQPPALAGITALMQKRLRD